ncbi:hypothetical protein OsJ_29856 [Oryza sativa Japonica Group]|uniref:3-beta hydroxysteroid dehydrogenase/isomerase domain-containing protein n=1 Tax=Oryza sativa subsp. japonica TaxID=39947 RepID=B9G4B8_ORYSJ|nr:hypothetical protein OsJ_29856 [Oryza sativa Japonica Group]
MPPRRVCVTGAGGFIGSWLVNLLLSCGYFFHGTVRNPDDPKNAFLKQLENATENLQLFKADVLDGGSLTAAFAGCEGVFHPATPKEMMAPAVKGTRNMLEACSAAGVQKLVVVSSIAAVFFNPSWPHDRPKDETSWSDKKLCMETELLINLIERCYSTAVGTGTARYQNPDRWIWPDPTAGRVWYRAVPILSLCSITRRTEVEGQKRNFAYNNRIGRDGRAARTLEALGFSIDRRRRRLLDRRRRLLEVNSAVSGNDDIDAAASGKDDIDAATAAGNDEFAAAVDCFNVAAATAAGKDDIDAAAAEKDDIDAAATGNDEFATAAACFNAAAAGKDEFDAAAAAYFNACRNPPLAAT